MKPRLLVTGSSHVAAVALGWKEITKEIDTVDVDFLAAPVKVFRQFERSDDGRFGLLKSPRAAGLNDRQVDVMKQVNGAVFRDLSDYTHVVVIGQRVGVDALLAMTESVGVDGIRKAPEGGPLLSRPAFDAIAGDIATREIPTELAALLKGPRICISAIPLRTEASSEKGEEAAARITARKANPEGLPELIERFGNVVQNVFMSCGLHFIGQPAETLTPFATTRLEYNRGSEYLNDAKEHDDPVHMNGRYGALCMRRITDWVLETAEADGADRQRKQAV